MDIRPLLKPLAESYNNWYLKRNAGERRLIVLFAVVSAAALYFAGLLKPAINETGKLKRQTQEYQSQVQMIISQYPDVVKGKREMEGIKEQMADAKLKILDIESKLIGVSNEQQLLTEIIKYAQELAIDLELVKQDVKEEKEGFLRLYIDLKFSAAYRKTIVYIRGIESISPVIRIEKMELEQSKNDPVSLVNVSISLSTILSREENSRGRITVINGDTTAETGGFKRSPFTPEFFADKSRKKNLKLSGITYKLNGGATAIINGMIVNVGDRIEKTEVKHILPDCVIVDAGLGEEKLFLAR